jgi:hypothetical protein
MQNRACCSRGINWQAYEKLNAESRACIGFAYMPRPFGHLMTNWLSGIEWRRLDVNSEVLTLTV